MIVRLKAGTAHAVLRTTQAFQFYDSPIKSTHTRKAKVPEHQFQFYDSPIKSLINTSKIQSDEAFQFYDSPIKRILKSGLSGAICSFNSMIVRLKDRTWIMKINGVDIVSIL